MVCENIAKALEVLVEDYSFIRQNIIEQDLNLLGKEINYDKNKNASLRIGDLYLYFSFYFPEGFPLDYLKLLEEWQERKVNLVVWGGSAYSFHNGKEETFDLDYCLSVSKKTKGEFDGSLKNVGGGYVDERFYKMAEEDIKFSKKDAIELLKKRTENYSLDFHGLSYLPPNHFKNNFIKILENDHVKVLLPTKKYLLQYWIRKQTRAIERKQIKPFPSERDHNKWRELLISKGFNCLTYEEISQQTLDSPNWKTFRRAKELARI